MTNVKSIKQKPLSNYIDIQFKPLVRNITALAIIRCVIIDNKYLAKQ